MGIDYIEASSEIDDWLLNERSQITLGLHI